MDPQWLTGKGFACHPWMNATLHHTPGQEDLERTFREKKSWAWVVISPSATQLPFSAFYQPVLSGVTYSKAKKFEGLPLSTYNLYRCGNILQVLESEAQQTPMMSPEGINRAKGEGNKV